MIKSPGSHFKLNKPAKMLLATILDPQHRNFIKKMEIDAQKALVSAKTQKPRPDKD
jgi:hypothetical protein